MRYTLLYSASVFLKFEGRVYRTQNARVSVRRATSRGLSNLKPDRDMTWQRWGFFLGLIPLALASRQLGTFGVLPVLACAMAAALFLVIRSPRRSSRLVAFDLLALLGAGTVAIYHTSMGEPTRIQVAPVLAAVLAFGSIAFGWYLEQDSVCGNRPKKRFVVHWPVRGLGTFVSSFRWSRGLAFTVSTLAITLVISARAFGPSPDAVTYTWLVTSSSFWPLWLLSFACIVTGRLGAFLTGLSLVILQIGAIWHIASTEVAVFQAHPLLWEELKARAQDPGAWKIALDGVFSLQGAILTLSVFGGVPLLAQALAGLKWQTSCLVQLRLLALVLLSGSLFVHQRMTVSPKLAERYLETSSAPWSTVHERARQSRSIDWDVAKQLRHQLEPPVWTAGAAQPFDSLPGRYAGRSVVLLLLESHSASHIAGLGEGAFGYEPSAPNLSRLAEEGLWFTNYFAPGFPTRAALWTVLTGLPVPRGNPPAVRREPGAARLGRMPDFKALGYRCDWLCPASTRFDNWDLLMTAVGVRWWIENSEVQGLSRDYWTPWGMPDEDLYRIALRRYRQFSNQGEPAFIGLLTISNHSPYSFPETINDQHFSKDHGGGMRYADHSMQSFIDSLRTLPPSEQPIVFITADTSYIENLRNAEPVGTLALEGLRIPGLLLLPDGYLSGEEFEGVFSHEDLLDFLYMLVAPKDEAVAGKFLSHHRSVAFANADQVLTRNGYFASSLNRWFGIVDYWDLRETTPLPDRNRIEAAWEQYLSNDQLLWPADNP